MNSNCFLVLLLRETLRRLGLPPSSPKSMTSKTLLAERILKAVAKGERNPERLIEAALMAVAA